MADSLPGTQDIVTRGSRAVLPVNSGSRRKPRVTACRGEVGDPWFWRPSRVLGSPPGAS